MTPRRTTNKPRTAVHISNKVGPESGTLLEPFTVKMTLFEVTLSVKKSPLLNSGQVKIQEITAQAGAGQNGEHIARLSGVAVERHIERAAQARVSRNH